MNLFQQEDALKGYTDDNLSREMRAPSGMVPQYMVMSELNRRKKMRQEAAARPDDNRSVMDDLLASAAPAQTAAGPQGPSLQPPGPQTVPGQTNFSLGGVIKDIGRNFNPIPMVGQSFKDIGKPKRMFNHLTGNVTDMTSAPVDAALGEDWSRHNMPYGNTIPKGTTHASYDKYNEGKSGILQFAKGGVVGYAHGGLLVPQKLPPLDENGMPIERRQPGALTAQQAGGALEGMADRFVSDLQVPPLDENMMPPATPVDTSRATTPNIGQAGSLGYPGGNTSTDFTSVLGADSNVSDPNDGYMNSRRTGEAYGLATNPRFAGRLPSIPEVVPNAESLPSLAGETEYSEDPARANTGGDPWYERWPRAFMEGYNSAPSIYDEKTPDQFDPGPKPRGYKPSTPADPTESGIANAIDKGVEPPKVSKPAETFPEGTMNVAARAGTVTEIDEFEAIRKMTGHVPGASKEIIDALNDKVTAAQSGIGQEYADAKWMALAQLGATMASGDSPYFAANFGAGASAGIKALRGAKADKSKKEMAFLGIEAEMANARIAAQQGDVKAASDIYGMAIQKILAEKNMANDLKVAGIRAASRGGDGGVDRKSLEIVLDSLDKELDGLAGMIGDNPDPKNPQEVAALQRWKAAVNQRLMIRAQLMNQGYDPGDYGSDRGGGGDNSYVDPAVLEEQGKRKKN